ncbi:MAG: NUDIX hydrolase, partial [Gemmatimonadales bacterium]
PGGRREPNDRGLLETALRETHEETGVELTPATCLGELDDLAPSTPVLPPVLVRPFVFGLPRRPETTLSGEVDRILWTPLLGLKTVEVESQVTVRGAELTVPAYRIGPHVVWGMTHRILKPFIQLIS